MRADRIGCVAALAVCLGASSSSAVEFVERPLVASRLAEVRNETRPVALGVRDAADGWRELHIEGVRVPPRATLEVVFGIIGGRDASDLELAILSDEPGLGSEQRRRLARGLAGWRTFTADLERLAGKKIDIHLRARSAGEDGGAGSGEILIGVPRFLVERTAVAAEKNVLLVSLDTLRADRLSSAGYPLATTPRLDALAGAGARFTTARAPASSTPPSHMTLLTGTSPCRHGVWGVHLEDQPPDEIESLATILSRAGYTTLAVTENAFVGAPFGFARGFDSFLEFKGSPRSDGRLAAPTGLGPQTFAAARRELRRNNERRFFLFVHTYQLHAPREPVGDYAALFGGASDEQWPEGRHPADHDPRRYDQLVRQVDDLVGELVDELQRLGLRDETLIVITSDHGEAFFEHGEAGHGFWVWDEVVRVPLILQGPGVAAAQVVEDVVGLQDVVPTVLDLLDLPVPPSVEGVSLLPAIAGEVSAERPHYAEVATGELAAISDSRFRILRGRDRADDIAFDLASDPRETVEIPVAAWTALPEASRKRLDTLREVLDRRSQACVSQRKAAAARRVPGPPIDGLRREKLRALGYID